MVNNEVFKFLEMHFMFQCKRRSSTQAQAGPLLLINPGDSGFSTWKREESLGNIPFKYLDLPSVYSAAVNRETSVSERMITDICVATWRKWKHFLGSVQVNEMRKPEWKQEIEKRHDETTVSWSNLCSALVWWRCLKADLQTFHSAVVKMFLLILDAAIVSACCLHWHGNRIPMCWFIPAERKRLGLGCRKHTRWRHVRAWKSNLSHLLHLNNTDKYFPSANTLLKEFKGKFQFYSSCGFGMIPAGLTNYFYWEIRI